MKATKVWFDNDKIFIATDDHQELSQSLKWYPKLKNATAKQRDACRLSAMGIHWDALDEDVSYESFTFKDEAGDNELGDIFNAFPELNISQIARRIGKPQSLVARYISGIKTPSEDMKKSIINTLHDLGQELMSI